MLPSTEDCNNIPEAEETLTNMDSTLNDSYQANETWQETATPEPVAEKKKKVKSAFSLSSCWVPLNSFTKMLLQCSPVITLLAVVQFDIM